jgi:uncharacterized protein YjbI with pentapeptide repeats
MPFEIRHHDGRVLFLSERFSDVRAALQDDMHGARLTGVRLTGANLEDVRGMDGPPPGSGGPYR